MTSITPGPFAFLAELGRAGGAAVQQAEEARQTRLSEAYRQASMLLKLSEMRKDPSLLMSDYAKRTFAEMGLPAVGPQRTSDELKEGILQRVGSPSFKGDTFPGVPGMIPSFNVKPTGDQVSIEERLFAGAPLPSAAARERIQPKVVAAEAAEADARVPQAQLAGASATAALPGIADTVLSGQMSAQDRNFANIADEIVQDLYNKKGRKGVRGLPTTAEAMVAGGADRRANTFGGKINESHYGAAIERLRQRLTGEGIGWASAMNRYGNTESLKSTRMAAIYQDQIDSIERAKTNLAKQEGVGPADKASYDIMIGNAKAGKQTPPSIMARGTAWSRYMDKLNKMNADQMEAQRNLNIVTQEGMGLPSTGGAGTGPTGVNMIDVNNRVDFMIRQGWDEDKIDAGIRDGSLDPVIGAKVREEFRRRKGQP